MDCESFLVDNPPGKPQRVAEIPVKPCFPLHAWSKWTLPKLRTYPSGDGFQLEGYFQMRVCLNCNKAQERQV